MADDFGRVNPVSPHFLDRGAREEPYQGEVVRKFGLRVVIGKGGMGAKTLAALKCMITWYNA